MRLWLILAATLALAACEQPDEQTAQALQAQRTAPRFQPPSQSLTPNCLSSALSYSCQSY
jgi:hypothetical protein